MFVKSPDEIHDSSPMEAAFRYGVQKFNVEVDRIGSHAGLFSVQPLLKLFGGQPMRGILIGNATFQLVLIRRISTMPKIKKKSAHFILFARRECR